MTRQNNVIIPEGGSLAPKSSASGCSAADWITIALPKGRLGDKAYAMLKQAGFGCPAIETDSRQLIFENDEPGQPAVRFFWAKPSDVAIYVEHGAADLGVVGKDILLESQPDVYELLDLNMGKCRMCVAGKADFRDSNQRTLRVATKFVNIASQYYRAQGRSIQIIKLNGSIEIAPILGLSDVIVDLVETGTTLRENNLVVHTEILPVSARLIANKSSSKFKDAQIARVKYELERILEERQAASLAQE